MAYLAGRLLLCTGLSTINLPKFLAASLENVIEAGRRTVASAHLYPCIFLASYCSDYQTRKQIESNNEYQHQHQDTYFSNNSRTAASPLAWKCKDDQKMTFIMDPAIIKDNTDPLEANMGNDCVNEVVRVLNSLQKTDNMSEKLADFSGQLSSHGFVMVLKLMHDRRLAFNFFDWYKQQPNYFPDLNSFMAVIRCLLHDAKWEKLSLIIEEMYAHNLYLNSYVFCEIMREASAKGRIDVSEKWYSRLKDFNITRDLSVFNAMMLAYNKAGKPSEVYTLFEEMWNSNVSPNALSYCHLLSACKSTRNVERAEVAFQQMKDQRIVPDLIACTLLLDIYGREGNIENLKKTLEEMKTLGIVPDARTYTCLIHAFGKAEMFDLVSFVFEDSHKTLTVLDQNFYSSTIRVYCQANKYKQAEMVVKFMHENHIPVNELCYSIIIAQYAKAGLWKSAIQMFNSMESASVKSGEALCVLMLRVYLNARQIKSCEQLFRNLLLRKQNRNAAAYEVMIELYEQTHRPGQISDLFNRMKNNNCVGNISIYNKFISVFGKSMNTSMASKVFEEMTLRKIKPTSDTYFLLLGAYLKAGERENAISLCIRIKRNQFMLEAKLMEVMIEILTKAGKLEDAEFYRKRASRRSL